MIPVISALSIKIFGISFTLMDLYPNKESSKLYTTATTEPSVAVKIPAMIPPITMMISSRQGIASKRTLTFSFPVNLLVLLYPLFLAMKKITTIQARPQRMPGM